MARSPRDSGSPRTDEVHLVTTASPSVADDQSTRMKRYLITMGMRTLCFVVAVATTGVLRWVAVGAAVVLPYIAVVMANAVAPRQRGRIASVTPYVDPTPRIGQVAHHSGDRPG